MPTCDEVCPGVLAAHCSNGPVDQADCVSGCNTVRTGPCAAQYSTLATCAGAHPAYTCDTGGNVTVTGCESHNSALLACLAGAH